MNEVVCPKCKTQFKLEDAGYANIIKQIRDQYFEEELNKRLELAAIEKENAIKIAEANLKFSLQEIIAEKEKQLSEINSKSELELIQKLAQKDAEILQIKSQNENKLNELKSQIEKADVEKKLAISEATQKIERERDQLVNSLSIKDNEKILLEKTLNEKFLAEIKTKDDIIKLKDEEILLRKDMKLRLSTKMLGESLEQHCEIEFNKLRATAFQNAYFEKDNDTSGGTKGDFIYKELDESGNEIISIMFEMKNMEGIKLCRLLTLFQKLI